MIMFIRLAKGISHHKPEASKRVKKDRLVFYLNWLAGDWRLAKRHKVSKSAQRPSTQVIDELKNAFNIE